MHRREKRFRSKQSENESSLEFAFKFHDVFGLEYSRRRECTALDRNGSFREKQKPSRSTKLRACTNILWPKWVA